MVARGGGAPWFLQEIMTGLFELFCGLAGN